MTLDWWLTYLLTTLILSLSPGSGAINTMSTGISHGYRGAAASIAGLQVGLSAHIVLVGIGLGALISLAGSMPRRRLFRRAVLVNLTNPKSIVFLAALFPQFILPNQPQAEQYLVLGVTTVVVDILVMIGYATLATRIAGWLRTPRQMQLLNRLFGSLFILVAGLLATARKA